MSLFDEITITPEYLKSRGFRLHSQIKKQRITWVMTTRSKIDDKFYDFTYFPIENPGHVKRTLLVSVYEMGSTISDCRIIFHKLHHDVFDVIDLETILHEYN